ncbi:hypothetical protein DIPPA_52922 [Diplonema papillatum]|nr:hypothetical protein DIPPA_52922 [Diplonema papillatum]
MFRPKSKEERLRIEEAIMRKLVKRYGMKGAKEGDIPAILHELQGAQEVRADGLKLLSLATRILAKVSPPDACCVLKRMFQKQPSSQPKATSNDTRVPNLPTPHNHPSLREGSAASSTPAPERNHLLNSSSQMSKPHPTPQNHTPRLRERNAAHTSPAAKSTDGVLPLHLPPQRSGSTFSEWSTALQEAAGAVLVGYGRLHNKAMVRQLSGLVSRRIPAGDIRSWYLSARISALRHAGLPAEGKLVFEQGRSQPLKSSTYIAAMGCCESYEEGFRLLRETGLRTEHAYTNLLRLASQQSVAASEGLLQDMRDNRVHPLPIHHDFVLQAYGLHSPDDLGSYLLRRSSQNVYLTPASYAALIQSACLHAGSLSHVELLYRKAEDQDVATASVDTELMRYYAVHCHPDRAQLLYTAVVAHPTKKPPPQFFEQYRKATYHQHSAVLRTALDCYV